MRPWLMLKLSTALWKLCTWLIAFVLFGDINKHASNTAGFPPTLDSFRQERLARGLELSHS